MMHKIIALLLLYIACQTNTVAQHPEKQYQLNYNHPAPNLPITSMDSLNKEALIEATPIDPSWENWSLPIGNGYMGASVFGRTVTERIQITENSMAAKSLYKGVGLTNFAELHIDFNHNNPQNYTRSLNINHAISSVKYEQDGVVYSREYFASYPDKVLVIKLTSSQKGKLSFTLRPQIPYKKEFGAASNYNGRSGIVTAQNDLITLSGKLEYLNILFEGQFKVIPTGGKMQATNDVDGDNGKIVVTDADAAIIIVAVGTNYKLENHIFSEHNNYKKLRDTIPPGTRVTAIINNAAKKTYDALLAGHKKDYTNLFARVHVDFGGAPSALTTDALLKNYQQGIIDKYLEELYFQYGRYLLICTSRPGTLPPNLQGIWNQYDIAPWTGGYWHNINIQMNYWPVFSTNLSELFQSFVDYNLAYRTGATKGATQYIQKNNPAMLSPDGDNGWTIGTGASAYNISTPGVHSGPGTGTMTTKMFWDYYEFTADKKILKELTYPAMLGMSKFLSKVVVDTAEVLLASPSYSPEQRALADKLHYKTIGSAFDQQMIFESHNDVLKAAKILNDNNPFLKVIKQQLPKLDPIQVGWSGQIKEYREEKYYGELVLDPKHRHTSQLVGLIPGTIINSSTPAWLDAAKVSLNLRGDRATGWGMAFRLNMWARLKEGDRAYLLYKTLLQKNTLDNLWDTHPPFQIDGNFGGTAGVAEMLLQSHEGFIDLLPALPANWSTGSFSGLVARGNFEVSAQWAAGHLKQFTIKAKAGGKCRLKYMNIQKAIVKTNRNTIVKTLAVGRDMIEFDTKPLESFTISGIPVFIKTTPLSGLVIKENIDGKLLLQWNPSPDAAYYNVYLHFNNAPGYTLIKTNLQATTYRHYFSELPVFKHGIVRVTAVTASGTESDGIMVNVALK